MGESISGADRAAIEKSTDNMRKYSAPAYKRVIIPVLQDCDCDWAVTTARYIAGQGEVVLVGLVKAQEEESLSAAANQARQVRKLMRRYSKLEGVRSVSNVQVSTNVVEELTSYVKDKPQSDLLLLEWPCHFEALGVTLEEVMHWTHCDLAVIRGPLPEDPKNLLVPIRGGPYAELAVRISLAVARSTQTSVTTLHITPTTSSVESASTFNGLAHILPQLPEINPIEIHTDYPVEAILSEAGEYDMVVIGASTQPAEREDFGLVAEHILQESPVAVMVVKAYRPYPAEQDEELLGQSAISILVDKWFAENTYHADEFSNLGYLLALKRNQDVTISLALPALNEEETVGKVIRTIKTALMDKVPILDEIVLMDSNSTDQTRQIASELGIPIHIHQETLSQYGSRPGKGEALWKSIYVTHGDILVWIDTDIVNIHPRFIYGLLGPLLLNPGLQFVKGFYRRPIKVGDRIQAGGGGRVTELTARPLLNLFFPELSGLVQPLSGEYGGRRSALEQLPFSSGYGVETGLLIDILERFGLNAIAQVDLRERIHHNQPLESLSKMSFAIIQTVIRKLERRYGRDMIADVNKTMKLIRYEPGRFFLEIERIAEQERPPIIDLPEYARRLQDSSQ